MLALTLGQAKSVAVIIVLVLIALAAVSAWVMKAVMQKVAMVVILGLLALLVWTQRASLQECSDKVRAADAQATEIDTTCSFLGRDVKISTKRDE